MPRRPKQVASPRQAPLVAMAERLRLALEMQGEGAALMRENLRRRHPDASDVELDALFERWLLDRPPDADGRRVPWPRRRRRRAA